MTAQELILILDRTVTGSQADLENARNFLAKAAEQNLPELLKQLSDILNTATNNPTARTQAALQLKNALYSRDDIKAFQDRWLLIPEDVRNHVKNNCFNALGTETTKPSQAAQCVGYIACAELPRGQWRDLIERLVTNVTTVGRPDNIREASLEALGYICQDIDSNVLVPQSNVILTALVYGMRKEETNDHVRLAATTAMLNSLEFTKNNFQNDSERHYIMQVVCEATQSTNLKIQVAALQNLVKILTLYYDYMEYYMGPALFAITMDAMKSTHDEIALQGIEFWSNVCDEEYELQLLQQEAQDQNRQPERSSRYYARGALPYLVPVLLQRLTMQEETDDDDDWNPCKAAGVCLMLLANCAEDTIIQYVFPFVSENIKHTNWQHREAAVMAFGSMLEGPDVASIKPIAEQSIPFLLELLRDSNVAVRDTTAWTIGRIFEFVSQAVMNDELLRALGNALVNRLADEPRVATNICWSFSSLARAAYDHAECPEDDDTPNTYLLSPFFDEIVKKLIETTDRPDGNQSNLRNAAYEALMEMIRHSPKDCYVTVQKTTVTVLDRLNRVISAESHTANPNDRVQIGDLQSLLCATLQSVLRKMHPNDAPLISDPIMQALLQMLKSNSGKASAVQEDALVAIGTLIEVLGSNFIKYVEHVLPFVYEALNNHAEYQICAAAVGVVGDLSRSLLDKLAPYCDHIMTHLLNCLGDDKLHRSVKPQILSTFGDIALAIGGYFKKYLEHVLNTLNQACRAQVAKNDYDMIDYLNELREGCLSAYTGIIQGLRNSVAPAGDSTLALVELQLVTGQLPFMVQFIETIARDPNKSDSIIGSAIGLIGDLVTSYGQQMIEYVERDPIDKLLTEGKRSKIMKTKTLAMWATKEIRKIKNN
ncbi:unnamed protein product [Rotaria magnacalcarata]|uniref:Importin N-terminal domain-containing protein n=8 Tax=Rotaria magnacalcarata TaxID=392030 RepID=A0A816AS39_9BILA|nr:unnamed protein product [Rotaria magnacalcarata]CAF1601866.1 unnamed protein product [Rotaria magnacalcarata]CAF1924007.1 unnamed protein product [Rotaria magnacalcarata]CAF2064920.1 unnamed protein product [Rotaria magnacalcarata]CAF2116602.1 unnamed protein product [Rotaria magnacalcarata]